MSKPSVKMICDMQAALRRDEANRQADIALAQTKLAGVVELIWTPSRSDPFRTQQFRYHGISDPLDHSGKVALQLSVPSDPAGRRLSLGLHQVGRISPVISDETPSELPLTPVQQLASLLTEHAELGRRRDVALAPLYEAANRSGDFSEVDDASRSYIETQAELADQFAGAAQRLISQ